MKRVAVTGIGAVTPIGNSFQESWQAAVEGRSGIGDITLFDAAEAKWKVAGELKKFNAEAYLSQKEIAHLDRFVPYALAASIMAAEDAGLVQKSEVRGQKSDGKNENFSLASAGVIIGSSRGGISTIEKNLSRLTNSNRPKLPPYLMPSTNISMAASYTAQRMGIKGYCLGISNSCASGANAIGEAFKLIKGGYPWPVFAGGAEAPLCRLCIEGYGASGALSRVADQSASRPFDKTRDGFVLAEGACILVLEDYEIASNRGARIYGEIIGYGNTVDAFHPTRPSVEGEAMAIKKAIEDSGLNLRDVDYVNAHGTSTPLGDRTEADAIKLVFGKKANDIFVTSVKSMTGHMLSASGAFEAAVTLMSLREGVITPTINLKRKDPECNLNCVTKPEKADIKIAVSNAFGFGGVNAVLVFKKG